MLVTRALKRTDRSRYVARWKGWKPASTRTSHGIADDLRARRRRRHGTVPVRAAGPAGRALGRHHRRAPPPARRGDRDRRLLHVRDGGAGLRDRRSRPARRPGALDRDRHAGRVRRRPSGPVARGPGRGARQPARARSAPGRRGRVRLWLPAWSQPRARLRALRGADPRRRDHRVGVAGLHRGQARGRAVVRGRLGPGALRADPRRQAARRPMAPVARPGADGDGSATGGDRSRHVRRPRHPVPDRDRRRASVVPREPDRGDRGVRHRGGRPCRGARWPSGPPRAGSRRPRPVPSCRASVPRPTSSPRRSGSTPRMRRRSRSRS